MFKQKIEGEICSDCGKAKNVKSSKTGKIFCADKCWLQGAAPQPQTPQTPVQKFEKDLDDDLVKREYKMEQALLGAQKNRSNLAASFLQTGEELTPKALRKLALLEGWVLNGKIEVQPAKHLEPVAAPAKPLQDKIADDPRFQERPVDALQPKSPKSEEQLRREGDEVFKQIVEAGKIDDVSSIPF